MRQGLKLPMWGGLVLAAVAWLVYSDALPRTAGRAGADEVSATAAAARTVDEAESSTRSRWAAAGYDWIDVAPAWAGHPVNFAMVTQGDFQYVGFYDAERRMTIAQRRLDSTHWSFAKLPSRVEWDSHNDISLEVDRDGFLHVSGNMHGDRLVYFRSVGAHDISDFERPGMVGKREKQVTYPRFLASGDGRLYFHYRDGKSGAGSTILNRYDESSKSWSRVLSGPLFDGRSEMSAYLSGPVVGPDGLFHLVWMWRDTPSGATNHDISYGRSRDLEVWQNAAGAELPLPLTPETLGVVVDPVRAGGGLAGTGFGVGWDAQQRPVVSYVKYDAAGDSQVFNSRFEDGVWTTHQTSSWSYRWDLDETGSLAPRVGFFPVSVDRSGRLIQGFDHVEEGRGTWVLDPETLRPVGRVQEPAFFRKLRTVESEFPGMEVRPLIRDRTGQYLLRWETLPIQRDRRRKPPYPPPSLLRVFRIPHDGAAPNAATG